MANNELIIRFTTQPGSVDENINQVSAQVDTWLADFEGMADVQDSAKADLDDKLRQLRAGRKTIDDERKRIKKAYLAPLEQFEAKVKPITEKIDKAIAIGKERSDEIQAKADERKRAEIEAWWNAHRPRGILVKLDQVWDKRYLNKTGLGVTWQQDLQGKIDNINREEDAIVSIIMEDHVKGNFISTDYARNLDLPGALSRWEQHQQDMKASEEVRLVAREMETRQNADSKPIQPQVQEHEEVSAPAANEAVAKQDTNQAEPEPTYWADFTIEQARLHIDHATLEQMKSLTLALNEAFGTDWHVARDENGNPRKGH
ncbi:MAG: DUF1351 domain-containing protein [Lactimicrobium massiliense]|nr:DUF1351 domain-containing protein [Lactimicrobium massiliense]MDD6559456.1 DUF1351 domain-containing protein [Lactimicrobium massiliense]